MAIIKCKMCGGDLNLVEGASTAECEFCGSVQTIPKVDDEKKLTLFARQIVCVLPVSLIRPRESMKRS